MKSYELEIDVVQRQRVLVQAESREDAQVEVMAGSWAQTVSQGPEYVRDIIKIEEIEE